VWDLPKKLDVLDASLTFRWDSSNDLSRGRAWLVRKIYQNDRSRILRAGYYRGLNDISSLLVPLIFNSWIDFLEDRDQPPLHGLILAIFMLLVIICRSLLQQHYAMQMQQCGIRAKGVVLEMAYKKVILL
jgi:hypothetical protein